MSAFFIFCLCILGIGVYLCGTAILMQKRGVDLATESNELMLEGEFLRKATLDIAMRIQEMRNLIQEVWEHRK